MVPYRAMLDIPHEAVEHVSWLIHSRRCELNSRRRRLDCFRQALTPYYRHSDQGSHRRHSGRMFTARVKAVCEPCNSGWMSALEGRVKPYLLPMIKGEIVEIPPEAQESLAVWTLKTALMCQVMLPQERPNLPAELFTDLYRDRRPAEEMKVFCGYMMPPQYFNGPSPLENRSIPSETRRRTPDGREYDLWATVVTILTWSRCGPCGRRSRGLLAL